MSQSKFTDYVVLNVIIPPTEAFPEQSIHTIYLRQHQPKIPTENDSRSLFMVNVPIDSTPSHLRAIIASLIGPGRFESISFDSDKELLENTTQDRNFSIKNSNSKKRKRIFQIGHTSFGQSFPEIWDRKLRRSGSSAILLLVDEKSVIKVLKAAKKLQKHTKSKKNWPVWGSDLNHSLPIPPLGSARYLSHHKLSFPDPQLLKSEIDAFMTEFELHEKNCRDSQKKARSQPDADGFITVTRGGRRGPARKEALEQKMVLLEERERKKRDGMEKAGFYRFQGREKRKAEAELLVRQFEEDKKKMQSLREKRGKAGFKPES